MKRRNQIGNSTKAFYQRTGLVLISSAVMAWSSQRSQAATLNWDPTSTGTTQGGGTGSWDLSSTPDWFNGTTDVQWTDSSPTGTDIAIFGGAAGTVTLNSSLSAAEVAFTSSGYSLTGANTLTLGSTVVGTTNLGLDASTLTAGTTTFGSGITTALVGPSAQTWNIGGGSTLVDNGTISGAIGLSKAGLGILTLAGNNSGLSGNFSLSAGQLNINSANALSAGTFSISTSFIDNTSGTSITNSASNPILLNGTLNFIGSNSLNLGTGTVTMSASRVINTKASTLEMDGAFIENTPANGGTGAGNYSFTKEGAGTLNLFSSANAWAGVPANPGGTPATPEVGTVILGGVLNLGSTGQLPNVPMVIGGGELNITNSGSGARTQTISTSAGLAPVGSLALASGRDVITLNNTGTGSITFTAATVSRTSFNSATGSQEMSDLFRGTNLGTAASGSAGATNIIFTTAPTVTPGTTNTDFYSATGTGTGTQLPVIRGALADTTATGTGMGFATYGANGVQVLSSANQVSVTTPAGYTATAAGDNVLVHNTSLTLVSGNPGKTTNTLQIDNTSGSAITFTNSGTALDPRNGLLFSGTSPITLTGGTIAGDGADLYLMSTDTALVTIASASNDAGAANTGQKAIVFGGSGSFLVTGAMSSASSGGFYINGPTVTVNATPSVTSNGFVVDGGGKLILGASFPSTLSSSRPFLVASGSSVDMNGISITNLDYLGDGPFNSGGMVTNSSATFSTLTLTQGSSVGNNRSYSGIVSGNINLVCAAISTVTVNQTLAGQSNYTGTTLISSGGLTLGITNAFPVTTALTLNGGGALPAQLNLAGFNQTVGSLAGTPGSSSATIANNSASTNSIFTVNGSSTTSYGGVIVDNTGTGGTISFVKQGSGTLAFSGNNTYSGGTTIGGGTFKANNAIGSTGSGFLTVNTGATLAGTGTIGGSAGAAGLVTLNGGADLDPGDNSLATLTIGTGGSLSVAGGAILDYDFTDSSSDEIVVNGGLTLNATSAKPIDLNVFSSGTLGKFSPTGTTGSETFNLIQYTGAALPSGTLTNFAVLNPVSASSPWSYTFDSAPGAGPGGSNLVQLVITFPPPESWVGNASSDWGTATSVGSNWSAAQVPNSAGQSVTFPGTASRFTVDLNGSRTVGAISFTGGGANTSYVIDQGTSPGGGILALDNNGINASITNKSGTNQTISAPLSLAAGFTTLVSTTTSSDSITLSGGITGGATSPIIASGLGVLALTGSSSAFHGGITINGGAVQINSSTSLGATDSVAIINAATLEATAGSNITDTRNVQVGAATSTIQVDGAGSYEIDGNISDASASGTLNLVTPGGGTLILAGNGTINNSGGINTPANGILQLGNTAGTTGTTVSGSGAVTNNGTINVGSASSGLGAATTVTISSSLAGAGNLNLNPTAGVGSGTLILGGTNANYSGTVTINNGTLLLANTSTATSAGTGTINLNNATLTETASSTTTLSDNYAATGTITPSNANVIGTLSIKTNGGTLVLGDQLVSSPTGVTAITGTTINRTTPGDTGTLQLGLNANKNAVNSGFTGTFNNSVGNLAFSSTGSGSAAAVWNFTSSGTVTVLNSPNGSINFGELSGSSNIVATGSGTGASGLRVVTGQLNLNTTYSGSMSGPVGLLKTGTGALTVSGQSNYTIDAVTPPTGTTYNIPVDVGGGTLIAASSTTGTTSGPLGPTATNVLIGSTANLSNATLATSGPVTIANSLTISGGGGSAIATGYTLGLAGNTDSNSTFSGQITLQNNLTVSQVANSGTNALNLTGGIQGTGFLIGPVPTTVPQQVGPTSWEDSGGANSGTNIVTFAGPGNINVTGPIVDGIASDITPAVVVVSVTGGKTTFSNSGNTFSGNTTITGGSLIATNTSGSATGTGTVAVGNASTTALTPTLGGTGIISGAVTVSGPGSGSAGHIAPGTVGASLGTLTFTGGLSFASSSDADFTLAVPSGSTPSTTGFSSLISVTGGGLTVPSGGTGNQLIVNLTDDAGAGGHGSLGSGTYELFSFNSLSGSFDPNEFVIGTSPLAAGTSYVFNQSLGANTIDLQITAVVSGPQSLTFTGSTTADALNPSGAWNINSTTDFTAGAGAVVYHDGDSVTFNDAGNTGAQYNITLDATGATAHAGSLSPSAVTVSTANTYTFGGAGIAGSTGLTKSGAGTLILNNTNTYTGNTNVTQGTLTLGAAGSIAGSANVNVGVVAGTIGTLSVLGPTSATVLTQTMGTLNVNNGAVNLASVPLGTAHVGTHTVLSVSGLAVTPTGKIDLTDNVMVVTGTSGTVATNLTNVATYLKSGLNSASHGYWNGTTGIVSSTAATGDSRYLSTIGYRQGTGSASFEGTTPGANDVIVAYTYYGDADLNGQVDGGDYTQIDSGFSLHRTGWSNGDFNYDGVVDGTDFALIDNAYNQLTAMGKIATPLALAAPSDLVASPSALIASPADISAVPEPTTLGLLGIGAMSLLGRRRRRNA